MISSHRIHPQTTKVQFDKPSVGFTNADLGRASQGCSEEGVTGIRNAEAELKCMLQPKLSAYIYFLGKPAQTFPSLWQSISDAHHAQVDHLLQSPSTASPIKTSSIINDAPKKQFNLTLNTRKILCSKPPKLVVKFACMIQKVYQCELNSASTLPNSVSRK